MGAEIQVRCKQHGHTEVKVELEEGEEKKKRGGLIKTYIHLSLLVT
jgi:hypothetical protein